MCCMAARKRPEKSSPSPPERDVVARQNPGHSDADFLRNLAKATTNKARKKLGLPSGRG